VSILKEYLARGPQPTNPRISASFNIYPLPAAFHYVKNEAVVGSIRNSSSTISGRAVICLHVVGCVGGGGGVFFLWGVLAVVFFCVGWAGDGVRGWGGGRGGVVGVFGVWGRGGGRWVGMGGFWVFEGRGWVRGWAELGGLGFVGFFLVGGGGGVVGVGWGWPCWGGGGWVFFGGLFMFRHLLLYIRFCVL